MTQGMARIKGNPGSDTAVCLLLATLMLQATLTQGLLQMVAVMHLTNISRHIDKSFTQNISTAHAGASLHASLGSFASVQQGQQGAIYFLYFIFIFWFAELQRAFLAVAYRPSQGGRQLSCQRHQQPTGTSSSLAAAVRFRVHLKQQLDKVCSGKRAHETTRN